MTPGLYSLRNVASDSILSVARILKGLRSFKFILYGAIFLETIPLFSYHEEPIKLGENCLVYYGLKRLVTHIRYNQGMDVHVLRLSNAYRQWNSQNTSLQFR